MVFLRDTGYDGGIASGMRSSFAVIRMVGQLVVASGIVAAVLAPQERGLPAPTPPAARVVGAISRENDGPAQPFSDLFRAGRVTPMTRYSSSSRPVRRAPPEPPPPKPEWRITGILGGRSPVALVAGVGGQAASTIVSQGDSIGRYVVSRIAADSVLVRHGDVVWALELVKPGDAQR